MATKCIEIIEKFPNIIQHYSGNTDLTIAGPSTNAALKDNSVVFLLNNKKLLTDNLKKAKCLLIVPNTMAEFFSKDSPYPVVVTSPNTKLAFAMINNEYFKPQDNLKPFEGQRVHPTALIAQSAKVAPSAIIGPYAVISENVTIGDNSLVGSHCVLEPFVTLGKGCHLHPHVFLGHHTILGERCEIHPQSSLGTEGFGYAQNEKFQHLRMPHYGKVVLQDDVHLGSGILIDRGAYDDTVIGAGTKVDNYCHFGHNVTIGKQCLFAAGTVIGGSTTIGDYCVFGGRVTISGHIEVCSKVEVAGLSGIHNSITEPGKYGGYPLQPLPDALKTSVAMTHLPEIKKNVTMILKKLGLQKEL